MPTLKRLINPETNELEAQEFPHDGGLMVVCEVSDHKRRDAIAAIYIAQGWQVAQGTQRTGNDGKPVYGFRAYKPMGTA